MSSGVDKRRCLDEWEALLFLSIVICIVTLLLAVFSVPMLTAHLMAIQKRSADRSMAFEEHSDRILIDMRNSIEEAQKKFHSIEEAENRQKRAIVNNNNDGFVTVMQVLEQQAQAFPPGFIPFPFQKFFIDDIYDDGDTKKTVDDRPNSSDVYMESNYMVIPTKCQGPPGWPGEPGWDGEQGEPGRDGIAGRAGILYEETDECIICPQGPPGTIGAPGERGDPGAKGWIGPPGLDGPNGRPSTIQGPAGPVGPPGVNGKPGAPGLPGLNTITGKGQPGEEGAIGRPGLMGSMGLPGRSFFSVEESSNGPMGQLGSPGNRGNSGPMGSVGDEGPPGVDRDYCPCPGRGILNQRGVGRAMGVPIRIGGPIKIKGQK